MEVTKREFIINELFMKQFMAHETNLICLEENEETGKSELYFQLESDNNFVIKNVDKKRTDFLFFRGEKELSMFKRVDHIIFENVSENYWRLHLIEMKSGVFDKKWREIKGKFRASYLLSQGLAAMLEMNITETCMYTTYERVNLTPSLTMPVGRRLPLGATLIKPIDEWDGGKFALNFGAKIRFSHTPIQMIRDREETLKGNYIYGN